MTDAMVYFLRAFQLLALPFGGAAIAMEASKAVHPCIGMEYQPLKMGLFVMLTAYYLLKAASEIHHRRTP